MDARSTRKPTRKAAPKGPPLSRPSPPHTTTPEQLRASLLQWISETEAAIAHVAGELEDAGRLAGVMSFEAAAAVRRKLGQASEALFEAHGVGVQLTIPTFLILCDN